MSSGFGAPRARPRRGAPRGAAVLGAAVVGLGLAALWAEVLRAGRPEDRAAGAGVGLAALLLAGGLRRLARP